MRIRPFLARIAPALVVVASVTALTVAQSGKPAQTNISAEEQTMLKAIAAAPDAAGKLKAAEILIKKFPKSSERRRVARGVADEIGDVKDSDQKIALAQQYQAIFKEPAEQEFIMPVLIDGLAGAKRFDDAFSDGAAFLKQNPDSLYVLVQLVAIGTEQAKQKNPNFVTQSLQYGGHAIELVEADKRPADMDDAGWTKYRSTGLPSLYQSLGLLNLVKGDRAAAKARLTKAATLAPSDPFNHLLLTGILNDEYQEAAKRYQGIANGPAKDEELKKVLATLDQVIDSYAHTIALAEGNERLAAVRTQYLGDLEAYYKYRHNNSTAGMQELIDKYKAPAK